MLRMIRPQWILYGATAALSSDLCFWDVVERCVEARRWIKSSVLTRVISFQRVVVEQLRSLLGSIRCYQLLYLCIKFMVCALSNRDWLFLSYRTNVAC